MRVTLSILLSVTLLAALVPPGAAATTEEQTKTYLGGGWAARSDGSTAGISLTLGELLFKVAPGDEIVIDIRDVTGGEVAAYLSFHTTSDYDGSLTGGVGASEGTEKVCHMGIVEVPETAQYLRIVLNSPETYDMTGCQPGVATWGTVTVSSAN